MSNNNLRHKRQLRISFSRWVQTLSASDRTATFRSLRNVLEQRHSSSTLSMIAPPQREQNREIAIHEAQERANCSGGPFIVFEVGTVGHFGIIHEDGFQQSFGTIVAKIIPQGKGHNE